MGVSWLKTLKSDKKVRKYKNKEPNKSAAMSLYKNLYYKNFNLKKSLWGGGWGVGKECAFTKNTVYFDFNTEIVLRYNNLRK